MVNACDSQLIVIPFTAKRRQQLLPDAFFIFPIFYHFKPKQHYMKQLFSMGFVLFLPACCNNQSKDASKVEKPAEASGGKKIKVFI